MSTAPVLIVDNHDSFVHTLAGYLHELGVETDMVEADAVEDARSAIAPYRAVLVSPGPG
ncbi:MAG: aminodeoxychorismate/anthranilate synthase component II, partial [Microbacterium sp.]